MTNNTIPRNLHQWHSYYCYRASRNMQNIMLQLIFKPTQLQNKLSNGMDLVDVRTLQFWK